jgi:hypothetical protein
MFRAWILPCADNQTSVVRLGDNFIVAARSRCEQDDS